MPGSLFLALSTTPAFVFATTFESSQGFSADTTQNGDWFVTGFPGAPGNGMATYGSWNTTNHSNGDEILTAASRSADGSRGLRHWRADGNNENGGGIKINLTTPTTELWVRCYIRFQDGFAFSPAGQPVYTKEHYWNVGGNYAIFGIQGSNSWGVNSIIGSKNYPSTQTWVLSQGSSNTGDGAWHAYEYHLQQNNGTTAGVIQIWIDNVLHLDISTAQFSTTPWSAMALGSNQSSVTGAGSSDYYTDYDDIAISTIARVGL